MFDYPRLRYNSGRGGWRGGRRGGRRKQQVDGSCPDAAIRPLDCSGSGGGGGWRFHPADPSQVSPFLLPPQSPGMDPKPGRLGGRRQSSGPTLVPLAFFNWRGGGSPATPTRTTAGWSPLRQGASTGKKREQACTSQTVTTMPFESLTTRHWYLLISPEMRRSTIGRCAFTTNESDIYLIVTLLLLWLNNTRWFDFIILFHVVLFFFLSSLSLSISPSLSIQRSQCNCPDCCSQSSEM